MLEEYVMITKNALEEIGIPEEEFDKYFLKLEN